MEKGDSTDRRVYWISDEAMLNHKCEWDDQHIETPRRLQGLLSILTDESSTSVLKECDMLQPSVASVDDIRLVHSQAHIEAVSKTAHMNLDELEEYCSGLEDVYANQHTYDACLRSAGCALTATQRVITEPRRFASAFAAIRPPGHHASRDTACGFCLFNNVAICAAKDWYANCISKSDSGFLAWILPNTGREREKFKARQQGVERILIVDWDVHAAQGTQYCIREDPGIKLISMHRFQYGNFWPNLPESAIQHDYDNTVNITLNRTGLGDSEYITLMQHLVAPIVADFRPGLILVSCGFDAALGDPEGEMRVTRTGFQWMTNLLVAQAQMLDIPLCMLLEGGYFVETLSNNIESCVKALMGKPLPDIAMKRVDEVFLESFHSVAIHYGSQHPRLKLLAEVTRRLRQLKGAESVKVLSGEYQGIRQFSVPYPTRGGYTSQSNDQVKDYLRQVTEVINSYRQPCPKRKAVLYVNEVQEENDETVLIHIDEPADEEVVRDFLQMHVCDGVEDISIARHELARRSHAAVTEIDGSVHQATVESICLALLKLFEMGLTNNLQHLLIVMHDLPSSMNSLQKFIRT